MAPAHNTALLILDLKHARFGCNSWNPGGAGIGLGCREFTLEQPMMIRGKALPSLSSRSGVVMPNLAAVSGFNVSSSLGSLASLRVSLSFCVDSMCSSIFSSSSGSFNWNLFLLIVLVVRACS